MGGAWVFPGGAVDAHEGEGDAAHRAAAVREVAGGGPASRCPTRPRSSRSRAGSRRPRSSIRFDTYFFLAVAPDGAEAVAGRPGDRRRALVRAGARARGLRGGRDADGLPDDQEPRGARRASTPPTRCSSGRRRTRSARRAARRGPGRDGADRASTTDRLTVAVTGPTGEIGRAFLRALRARRDVTRVLGMARRPFDPGDARTENTEYRQGDVLDREAVDALAARGRRARPPRLHHHRRPRRDARGQPDRLAQRLRARPRARASGSSTRRRVAAYGFHADNPQPLTEDVPPRGSERFYYSAQKAELEAALRRGVRRRGRPTCCARASSPGPDAPMLLRQLPPQGRCSAAARPGHAVPARPPRRRRDRARGRHAGDGAARRLQPRRRRHDHARRPRPRDRLARLPGPAACCSRPPRSAPNLPLVPTLAQWVNAGRAPVVMDTAKARRELGWRPRYDTRETLDALAQPSRSSAAPTTDSASIWWCS